MVMRNGSTHFIRQGRSSTRLVTSVRGRLGHRPHSSAMDYHADHTVSLALAEIRTSEGADIKAAERTAKITSPHQHHPKVHHVCSGRAGLNQPAQRLKKVVGVIMVQERAGIQTQSC